MITGFNTDVDHGGRVFHVQTEDKGLQNPVVESLVYSGGEIITSRRTSYEELTENGQFSEDTVLSRMEAQHQALIRDICNGKFDRETPKPFGHSIVSNRTLDEVALEYLIETVELGPIHVDVLDKRVLHHGTAPHLRIQVTEGESERPIEGADVMIRLVSTAGDRLGLFRGRSGAGGLIEATVEIPEMPGQEAALVLEAEILGRRAESRQLIEHGRRADSAPLNTLQGRRA